LLTTAITTPITTTITTPIIMPIILYLNLNKRMKIIFFVFIRKEAQVEYKILNILKSFNQKYRIIEKGKNYIEKNKNIFK